jgi:hypothetical protein
MVLEDKDIAGSGDFSIGKECFKPFLKYRAASLFLV